ncbi:MAG: hypothetical protein N2712_06450 [Brevinematales bacterium]|nr:hypothetical protein [Brevinematales bacterium]
MTLKDILGDVIGFTDNENIQNFESIGLTDHISNDQVSSDHTSTIGIPNITTEPKFTPEKVIFFDSVIRSDFTAITKSPSLLVSFITVALGYTEAEYNSNKPIELNNSTTFEVKRYLVASKSSLKNRSYEKEILLRNNVRYEIHTVDTNFLTVSDIWEGYILRSLLPEVEKNFVIEKIFNKLNSSTILIKDGNLFSINIDKHKDINIFGHVKNFNVPKQFLEGETFKKLSEGSIPSSEIYKHQDGPDVIYYCYANLCNSNQKHRKSGIFNLSRIDMKCSQKDNKEILDRFNFILKYFIKLTSVFSDSPRFPQNLPMIESLERFLRTTSGNRELIKQIIVEEISRIK